METPALLVAGKLAWPFSFETNVFLDMQNALNLRS